jgi:hypothetical protein
MYFKNVEVVLLIVLISSFCLAQDLQYYRPVGFQNPLLKSGQFISSISYYHSAIESTWDTNDLSYTDTRQSDQYLDMFGYLGLTDNLTINANLNVYPSQIYNEIIKNGSGKNKIKLNVRPNIVLSYRPNANIEIFGNLYYINETRKQGDQTVSGLVPIGYDPNTGEAIYETAFFKRSGLPDLNINGNNFRLGITYIGELW